MAEKLEGGMTAADVARKLSGFHHDLPASPVRPATGDGTVNGPEKPDEGPEK